MQAETISTAENIELGKIDLGIQNAEKALENKLKASNEKIKEEAGFYVEGTEQMKVCVENNSKAMDMFCMDIKKGLFSAASTRHLSKKLKMDS